MQRYRLGILTLVIALAGAVPATLRAAGGAGDTGQYTLDAGTHITVQMIDSVDSKRDRPGDEFAGTVAEPVVVGDRVVIPKGAEAKTRLVEAKTSGHIKGQSELELELTQLTVSGQTYTVESGLFVAQGESRGKSSAKRIGGGAGLGALIGAIAGGGKGAAIGAGVGAGAGTAVQESTHGDQVKVPSESKIEFVLKNSVTITK
jgi:YmgG-like glycine-zipper protein